jgi:RNA polymerase sigma-70 factor (ECF subfamily)
LSDATAEFDELFRYEYPQVVRSTRLILGDKESAEEVVQDAFAQLLLHWRKVSRYEANAALRVDRPRGIEASDPDVYRALRALPALQRAAVVLHHMEDRPLGEVADLLGCAEGTVKSHLHRARKRLSALLQEEANDVAR